MQTITKFYLKNAVYEVEVDGEPRVMIVNYGTNTHEIVGKPSRRLSKVARQLLAKKHRVNFAYKFDGKIKGGV